METIDSFVTEIFELAETDEIRQRAEDILAHAKAHKSPKHIELKETDIANMLKMSYIADRFFGKSRFWISSKLNHNLKNGKPDDFTGEQRETLKKALLTISSELQALAERM